MSTQSEPRLVSQLKWFSQAAGAAVIAVGSLVLIGWTLGIATLKSILPGLVTMKVNTAVAFLLAGVSLWLLLAQPAKQHARRTGRMCALAVALVGVVTLSQYLFSWDLAIDQLLFQEPAGAIGTSSPGRMAPNSALNFLLLGCALLLLDVKTHRGHRPAQFLSLAAALVALLALVGYAYGVRALYGIAHYTQMALHTALTFFVLSVGLLCVRPDRGLMAIVASDTPGGIMVRRLLPAAIILPAVLGWLRLVGERRGLYATEFGVTLMVVVTMGLLAVLIWWSAQSLHRTDTERQRAEQALQESEERYRMLFENSPQPMWVFDLETLAFLAVNAAAVRHYGYSQEEFLAMTIKDIRPAQEIPLLLEHLFASPAEGYWISMWRHRKKDGRVIDVEVYAQRVTFDGRPASLVLVNDITERKQAEEALRASEERTRLIVDRAQDAFIAMDAAGLITGWNPQAEATFGWSRAEALGRSLADTVIPARHREAHRHGLQHFLATGEGPVLNKTIEMPALHQRGHEFPIELSITPLRWGDTWVFNAFLRDITERKQAEEQIRRFTADLAAANRELEAFTYSVAHDLRAPLRHVDGFSKILLEEVGPRLDPTAQHYLRRIQEGTRQMGCLVDDLLNLSRVGRQELRPQLTGLNSLVEDVLKDLKPEMEGRQIEWRIGRLPFVDCDPALMKQVLANLLSNAVKFTRPRERAVIEVGTTTQNAPPVVFVRDNGVGFSMKYADKLFGIFQRLHRQEDFEGTGVGLATVQRIIHKHGGRIWGEAELDKGATFSFTLGALESSSPEG